MGKLGFKTTWMNTEEISEIETPAPIQNIVNEPPVLTPAHAELVDRLNVTETIIMGKNFAKFTDEKKKNFVDEYKWLVAINAQLGGQ